MKKYIVNVNGNRYEVEVEEFNGEFTGAVAPAVPVAAPVAAPKAAPVAAPKAAPKKVSGNGEKIEAPMPGNILRVNVNVGDAVKKGDVLLVLEAMKMENEIKSPKDGTIGDVAVKSGAQVNTGDVLVVIE